MRGDDGGQGRHDQAHPQARGGRVVRRARDPQRRAAHSHRHGPWPAAPLVRGAPCPERPVRARLPPRASAGSERYAPARRSPRRRAGGLVDGDGPDREPADFHRRDRPGVRGQAQPLPALPPAGRRPRCARAAISALRRPLSPTRPQLGSLSLAPKALSLALGAAQRPRVVAAARQRVRTRRPSVHRTHEPVLAARLHPPACLTPPTRPADASPRPPRVDARAQSRRASTTS